MKQTISHDNLLQRRSCPICGSNELWSFFELFNIPTQDGVVWESKAQALDSPVGDIQLVYCQNCDFIGNQKYDPNKVQFSNYDFTLHHSPIYQDFIDSLASRLVESYQLNDKTLIDLGCGRGHFLHSMCELGNNKGIGIDPSLDAEESRENESDRVTLIKDFYSKKYAYLHADFVACRHVIDELEDPVTFVQMIRDSLNIEDKTIVYMEVPNALKIFSKDIIWNIGYAKHFWFTPTSLTRLFERCHFKVLNVETCMDEEYLGIEATPCVKPSPYKIRNQQSIHSYLEGFSKHFARLIDDWQNRIDDLERQGRTVVVWGAGMRAINFLNKFNLKNIVQYVVDVNPSRQGKYLPRTAYNVKAPEELKNSPPDIIIISNSTYSKEIQAQAKNLGLSSEFLVL
jgi:hypothetical protein